MKTKHLLIILFVLPFLLGASWPLSFMFSTLNPEKFGSTAWINKQIQIINNEATNINPQVVKLGLHAYIKAREHGLLAKQMLTIIDYSKPSTEKRMWVFDLNRNRILYNTWVSHGRNSGGIHATSFSNERNSLKSSLGVFLTENSYVGGVGYALRIKGLEPGFNDNALRRNVVIHGAWYVDPGVIQRYGQLGRSWGCPAVSKSLSRRLIDTIKGETLVFIYYPDRYWLNRSRFLA